MFDLSWGVCKRNGGNGVQGGYMGLSWGVFTTEKVMSRVGCLICPGGCKRNGGNGVQGGYMGLSWGGLHYRKSDVQGRMFDLSWGCVRRMVEMVSRVDIWVCLGGSSLQKK